MNKELPAVQHDDPNHGKGGSYMRDPVTGALTLIERAEQTPAEAVAATVAAKEIKTKK